MAHLTAMKRSLAAVSYTLSWVCKDERMAVAAVDTGGVGGSGCCCAGAEPVSAEFVNGEYQLMDDRVGMELDMGVNGGGWVTGGGGGAG